MTTETFGAAYERGWRQTIRFLLSRGCKPHDHATEVAQAAWVHGWERRHQLREERFIGTWVNTIALNLFRSRRRADAQLEQLPEICGGDEVDFAAIDVARFLESCRPNDRYLLRQHMGGATSQELAFTIGLSPTAVRHRILRARQAIRSRFHISKRLIGYGSRAE